MRVRWAAVAGAILIFLPPGVNAQDAKDATGSQKDAAACQAWDHGEAARQYGWTVDELTGAQKIAFIRYYDERVAPRADAQTDSVVFAVHPEWPLVRVVIARGDCILDMGQMGPDVLQRILREAEKRI